jgi:hypothetical protein
VADRHQLRGVKLDISLPTILEEIKTENNWKYTKTGGWKNVHIEGFRNFYPSPNII